MKQRITGSGGSIKSWDWFWDGGLSANVMFCVTGTLDNWKNATIEAFLWPTVDMCTF